MLYRRLTTKTNLTRKVQAKYTVKSATESFKVVTLDNSRAADLKSFEAVQTELPGGVKVLSVDAPVPVTSLSVYVQAGSRYENFDTIGSTHFLKHLAYRGTHFKSALRLVRDLEYLGATLTTQNTRDHLVYSITAPRTPETGKDQVELAVVAETLRFVLSPSLLEFEVEQIRKVVAHDIQHTDLVSSIIDRAHVESFRDSGLGQSAYCPEYAVSNVTPQIINSHVTNNFFPGNRITIIGAGVEHGRLLAQVTPLFSNPKYEDAELIKKLGAEAVNASAVAVKEFSPLHEVHPTSQNSVFTGGNSVRLPSQQNTVVALAFPGASHSHADAIVYALVKELLGASGSTVPVGEGLSSSLATKIGSVHSFVKSASAFNYSYSDAGLFGVVGVAQVGGNGAKLAQAMYSEVKALTSVTDADLSRAKNILKARHLRSWFGGEGLTEQLATRGTESIALFFSRVDGVSLGDVHRVAKSLASVQPNIVSGGDVRGIPSSL